MSLLDKRTSGDLVKLLIFILITSMATGVLVVLIGNLSFESTYTYKAVFSDATGLNNGDDVRIAGVRVGSVKSIQIVGTDRAEVTFSVAKTTELTHSSDAAIRYRNLVGQRYISISQGVGNTARLDPGQTIPLSQTQPALDLTVLFNGFKPLFTALSPSDVNQLSYELIQVFQGEGGNLQGLLQNTASITNTLADRDQVIGSLITNLTDVLHTIGSRDTQLSSLIVEFRTLIHGLADDRNALLTPLDNISTLTQQTADLTVGIRPGLKQDILGLRQVATNLNNGRGELDRALQILPIKLTKIGRTAIYGSFFNFYLCNLIVNASVGKTPLASVSWNTLPGRCQLS